MRRPQHDIYVTLPSNVPGVPGNKLSNFKTVLPTPLKLNGAWDVALLETHYPHQIPNFKATTLVVVCTEKSEKPQGDQPQPLQSQRARTHYDQVDGYWPSGEEAQELDPGVTRYRAHEGLLQPLPKHQHRPRHQAREPRSPTSPKWRKRNQSQQKRWMQPRKRKLI